MDFKKISRIVRDTLRRLGVIAGAAVLTLLTFLVLPLMQQITQPKLDVVQLTNFNVANIPPPPPPPEQEEEQEEEPEPDLDDAPEDVPPLDLSQLELMLGDGFGSGVAGDFTVKIDAAVGGKEGSDAIFSESDLDQAPRALYQPGPQMTPRVRKAGGGQVWVIFIVDERGRVSDAKVQSSSNQILDRPALAAVKQWKFEPAKRKGVPVSFRMRVPITFPQG